MASRTRRRPDRGRRPRGRRRRLPAAAALSRTRRSRSSRRAARSAGRGTSSASRASARTRTCSRSATRSARGRGRGRSSTARRSSTTCAETAREHGVDRRIRFHHRVVAAEWSSQRRALDGGDRARRHRRDGPPDVRLPVHLHRLLPLRRGLHPRLRGRRALRRRDRAPAVLDRRRRLRRQARGRHRQRRHRGDGHPGARPGGPPRHDAPALAQLHPLPAGDRSARRPARARPAGAARLSGRALEERAGSRSRSTASAAAGPRRCGGCCARSSSSRLPAGFDVDTHFTPRYEPWDQRMCIVPDGDLFEAIADGRVSVVTDRIETFTETGPRARVRGRARGRPDRHRHRAARWCRSAGSASASTGATSSWPRRSSTAGCRSAGCRTWRSRSATRTSPGRSGPTSPASRSAGCSSTWTARGYAACTPRNRDPAVTAVPFAELTSGYVLRAIDRFPKQGSKDPWRREQNYAQQPPVDAARPDRRPRARVRRLRGRLRTSACRRARRPGGRSSPPGSRA